MTDDKSDATIVRLIDSVPCSVIDCEKPAYALILDPNPEQPKTFIAFAQCEDCTRKLAKLYGVL